MKTILVTGGAGFIGSNFVRYFLEHREDSIVNVDKLTYAGNKAHLKDLEGHPRHQFIQADIVDYAFMESLFEKHHFDGVIHFAAETHVDRSIENSHPFIQTNIVGTHVLLELARKYDVKRYHQISTDEVYGDLGDSLEGEPLKYFTEQTPYAPNCPYAASKASADILVESFYKTYGLPAVITRCSNNYGPYQYPEKLIPFLISRALKNEPLPIYGDGKNIRDWLYVLDHCEAILTVFEKSPNGEIWNIGGHNEKTNLEIVELILKHLPYSKSQIQFVPDRKAHDRRYAMDPSKLQNLLGWKPRHTFEEALPKTIEWYLKQERFQE